MNAAGQLILWLGEKLRFPSIAPTALGQRMAMHEGVESWERLARWFESLDVGSDEDMAFGSAALDAIDAAWRKLGRPAMPAAPRFEAESRRSA